jgi:hypothetical protein
VRKRLALVVAASALAVGMLPAPASAGQYCERADEVGAGDACRAAGTAAISVCNKVAGIFGNECGLG